MTTKQTWRPAQPICNNKFSGACLRCGTHLEPGDGAFARIAFSYGVKNAHRASHETHRLHAHQGLVCNACVNELDRKYYLYYRSEE